MNVIVTGGGSGIGLAIAEALLRQGARVCITGRDEARLCQARQQLEGQGGELALAAFDVRDGAACRQTVADLAGRWGPMDALINNAGVYGSGGFLQLAPQDFEAMFATNVVGPVQLMQAVLPGMIERRHGRIVNIASTAGKWGSENQSHYNSSKHALVGLTRCVALEMARHGITVNAICPGLVDTEMGQHLLQGKASAQGTDAATVLSHLVNAKIPLRRLVLPPEIAQLVLFLLSPAAAGMTGQSIVYDGGTLQI